MPIKIQMPALSPTMEVGNLAKWLVKEGDSVSSGDLLAEIETDKATMEFEAVDEGVIGQILVPEGSENVKVGEVIALLLAEGESAGGEGVDAGGGDAVATPASAPSTSTPAAKAEASAPAPASISAPASTPAPAVAPAPVDPASDGARISASPLARRIAAAAGIDLASVKGSGPNGRIVKADLDKISGGMAPGLAVAVSAPTPAPTSAPSAAPSTPVVAQDFGIPHEVVKLSNMRKTIARRLTESKQTVPHIYLTVDVRLDALLQLRAELNATLTGRGVKLSVNDMLIKALGIALITVPECNVQFAGDQMLKFSRADVSVAVSIPAGLITPIITDAAGKSLSAISNEMRDLGARAKDGKLQPQEYQGGTASISNMGMMGIKQFEAVINPPQGMIMAIGAGEKRPFVVEDAMQIATVMSATGSFDHRAIDGADGARLMSVFRELVEKPLGMLA